MSSESPTPPLRPSEGERLAALHTYDILDTPPEAAFQDIARLASHICQVPVALISLVDKDRQWFKASVGLDVPETGRDVSFCAHALGGDDLFVVPDATQDARFAANPLVTDDPHVRFYAGAPLRTPEGHALGTLCVIDRQARGLDPAQRDALRALAGMVMAQLELRRTNTRQAALLEENKRTQGRLRMLEAAVEQASDVILITEAEPVSQPGPRVVYVNPAFTRHTGYAPEEIIGRTPRLLHGPDTDAEMRDYLRARLKAWKPTQVELLNYKKDGTAFWSEVSIRPVADETGWYTHWVSVQRDITLRKRAEAEAQGAQEELERRVAERTEELRAANDALLGQQAFLRQVIDTAPNMIFAKDGGGRFTLANRAIAEIYGTTPDAMIGRTDADFSPTPAEVGDFLCADRRVIATGKELLIPQELVTEASGRARWFQTIKTPLGGADGAPQVLGVSTDITERKALEAERERLLAEALERADRDPLTGLLNHRAFHKCLAEEAERARLDGAPLAVAVLDLDNFKFFNDVYGHAAGDDVLRQVADGMRRSCRASDTLARFGGDEFALLMPGAGGEEAAALEARLAGLSYRPAGAEVAIPLTLSIGVAVFPEEGEHRLAALDLADARLRRAKSGGDTGEDSRLVRLRAAQSVNGFPMLDSLVTAVDNKDRYTRRHSEDVMAYCLQIALELGLDAGTRHLVQVAALLHDVGKIGVPDHILRKPGRLTDEEFEAVKRHPEMGAVMAASVPGLEEMLGAIRHHHERWDGAGYPGGLRGEETPLLARMMAVADAFSAMTTDRPYRQGMAEARALQVLCEGRGTQWDPACVDAFLRARRA